MEQLTKTFVAPSGATYEIREQNGNDEEILSNEADAKDLMNITKFIASIVVNTTFTTSGKLSIEDALNMPLLDRMAILFQSRIFSLGDTVEFEYDWGTKEKPNKVLYEQNLNDFLFDYSTQPTEEELESKPDAIPYYPDMVQQKDNEITLSTGKILQWDYLNGNSELYMLNLTPRERTRNSKLLARNLRLNVEGNWDKVTNFSIFSLKEMAEIRKAISAKDPEFFGNTEISNPDTGETIKYPIMLAPTFFYLTEA